MANDLSSLTISEVQNIAVRMKDSSTNLLGLLENLLKWTQIKQGLIPFTPEGLMLLPIFEETIEMVSETVRKKEIKISFDTRDDVEVYADKNILQTILRNLVSNAVKFTPKGGKIRLSAKSLFDKSVEISVKDSGIGMDQDMVENLFSIGFQTNRKGTENEPSTGLGLLLCKEFVDSHQGSIRVDSEEGKGSTFYFTLPCNLE